MRQLAAADPGNGIWVEDLRTFEQTRFREIQNEATLALKNREPSQLAKLLKEVQGQTWLQPAPKGLAQKLAKADAELRGAESRAALLEVEKQLDSAFSTRDPIKGRGARQDWEKHKSAAAVEHDDPMLLRLRPILDWLKDEDRRDQADGEHATALAALVNLIENPRHVHPRVLERTVRDVLSHGRRMPEELQRRCVVRSQLAKKNQTRRLGIIGVAVAAAMMLLAGSAFYLARYQMRSGAADRAARDLTEITDRNDLDEGAGIHQEPRKDQPRTSDVSIPGRCPRTPRDSRKRGGGSQAALRWGSSRGRRGASGRQGPSGGLYGSSQRAPARTRARRRRSNPRESAG